MLENPVYFCVIGNDGSRSYGKSGHKNNVYESKKSFAESKLPLFPHADRIVVYDTKETWSVARAKG